MKELCEKEIKEILRIGPEKFEKNCQERLRKVLEEFIRSKAETEEYQRLRMELIQTYSMPGYTEEIHISSGYKNSDQILNILENSEHSLAEYSNALYIEAQKIVEDIQHIRRFKIIYRKLPQEWQNWLWALYHDNIPWKTIEIENDISHARFTKIRKNIIEEMCRLFNSSLTDAQLICAKWISENASRI
ncbi:MAG TPA: hypothetical protein IAB44_04785 [Candidatus Limivivens intestinipullorum]|uniref:Uncharacterized protein n=1 Tax=Candidatus Limivivens intestinipullorum TaxID=2840858 RepID=A0A9D1ES45_9FIRM|nr:hypothetical protein [Candidatus Limivivens intestinipullorum]